MEKQVRMPLVDKPRVTVGMITYNQEAFIGQALDSVLAQDYVSVDILVADDASSDKTVDILKTYADKYPEKIRLLLAEKNAGISANCNRLMSACKTDLFMLLAGDDIMLPGAISKSVVGLQKNPQASLCHFNLELFDSDTNRMIRLMNPPGVNIDKMTSVQRLAIANYVTGPGVMVRMDCVPKEYFNVDIPTMADWLFSLEVAMRGGIVYLDDVLVRYRIHAGNITKRRRVMLMDSFKTLEIIGARYPELKAHTQLGEALLCRGLASLEFMEGHMKKAREAIRLSVSRSPFQLKTWILMGLICVGSVECYLPKSLRPTEKIRKKLF